MNNYANHTSKTRNEIKRKFVTQRIMGAVMIAIMIFFFAMVRGTGEDATGGLVIGFIGIWLLVSRHILIL